MFLRIKIIYYQNMRYISVLFINFEAQKRNTYILLKIIHF